MTYPSKNRCREREKRGRKWKMEAVHMYMLVSESENHDLLHENMGRRGDVRGSPTNEEPPSNNRSSVPMKTTSLAITSSYMSSFRKISCPFIPPGSWLMYSLFVFETCNEDLTQFKCILEHLLHMKATKSVSLPSN